MAIRKQVMLHEETWRLFSDLAHALDVSLDDAAREVIQRAFRADPKLARRVDKAREAREAA